MEPKLLKITMHVRRCQLLFQSSSEVWLLFRSRSSKVMRSKSFFCFRFTANQDQRRVSLESPGLENISQGPGISSRSLIKITMREMPVSATVSVLKWSMDYISAHKLESERSKSLCCVHFTAKQDHQAPSLDVQGTGNYPPGSGNIDPKFVKITMRARRSQATLSVVKWTVGLYFGLEARKCAFKNLCCVNFTANHGHQELV